MRAVGAVEQHIALDRVLGLPGAGQRERQCADAAAVHQRGESEQKAKDVVGGHRAAAGRYSAAGAGATLAADVAAAPRSGASAACSTCSIKPTKSGCGRPGRERSSG